MAAGEGQSVFLRDVALRGCPCSKTPSYTMLTQIALKGLGRFKKNKKEFMELGRKVECGRE